MLISIAGTDGVGKSTVAALLKQELDRRRQHYKVLDRWDVCQSERYPQCRFIGMPREELRYCIADMPGPSRVLFLFWKMYTVLEDYDPNDPTITFIDSYWMKHAAAEIVYGIPRSYVNNLVSLLPKTDLTVLLQVAPEIAFDRKTQPATFDLVPYECGMDAGMAKNSFLSHQTKLGGELDQWAQDYAWARVDAAQPVAAVAAEVIGLVNQCLDHEEQRAHG